MGGVTRDADLYYTTGPKALVKSISVFNASTLSKWSVNDKPLRGYDLNSKTLEHQPLQTIYTYPDSKLLTLITEDNYKITISEDCQIYTIDGWKKVKDLELDDVILANGTNKPPYMDKENLKTLYIDKKMSQKAIAELYGVSPRTIRVYVDKFDLHRGDSGALFGVENPNWKGDQVTKDGGYSRTHNLVKTKRGVCDRCGFVGKTDIHHDDRNPVNTDESNLIELCVMCHKAEHLGASVRWCRPAKIVDIMYEGYDKTYGFNTSLGNCVVNGFIVKFSEDGATIKNVG